MTPGVKGRALVGSLVQHIGDERNERECARDRVGQEWASDLYTDTQRGHLPKLKLAPMSWYEILFDPPHCRG
eukprot:3670025-Pyramimonas_sp.AAC.1